jgi:hypothetical protein
MLNALGISPLYLSRLTRYLAVKVSLTAASCIELFRPQSELGLIVARVARARADLYDAAGRRGLVLLCRFASFDTFIVRVRNLSNRRCAFGFKLF